MHTFTLDGVTYTAKPPATFADREDIVSGWTTLGKSNRKALNAFAATIALCTPEIAALVPPFDTFDGIQDYGKVVYEVLRGKGFGVQEMGETAVELHRLTVEALFPRAVEVTKAMDFTAAEAPPT